MMFPKKIYQTRRSELKESIGSGIILLLGNEDAPMNYTDNAYRFRQDSTFLYYFGVQRSGLAAIIDVEEDLEVIFGDEYSVEDIVWRGSQASIQDKAQACGISRVMPWQKLSAILEQAKKINRVIHYLPPYRSHNKIKLHELLSLAIREVERCYSLDLVKAVIKQREFKSPEEINELEEAVNVSVDMHVTAIQMARPGMTESKIAAEIQKIALANGGNISFPIIATINGQTLHNHYHGNTIQKGDLFLVDAGYENKMCYAGDLSSTFPVSKKFTAKQKEIYQLTLEAHQAAIDTLALGVPFKTVHLMASQVIFDGLKALGLTRGNTQDAIESGAHALFFPCGTGHMMGLDVHDMEDLGEVWVGYNGQPKSMQFGLKSLRLAKPLQPGHVFTIEPGIYFIPELIDLWKSQNICDEFINWDKVESYRNFGGIRNEEDFVMTDNGARRLGKPKPKTIEEIESIRSEAF